jgi:hypothetical protein
VTTLAQKLDALAKRLRTMGWELIEGASSLEQAARALRGERS